LAAVGHPEWIAASEAEYVEKAVALAADAPRLAEIKAALRDDVRASPLSDEVGFARAVEASYRAMWRRWCAGLPASDLTIAP
jgi:predicted O-linked N-acetylglucosamine transferase (SPINDLY family)